MEIAPSPLTVLDWSAVDVSEACGETGTSRRRVHEIGVVNIKLVELSPGYLADGWCDKGHVIHCLAGEVEIRVDDGRAFTLRAGMTCHVGDGVDRHRGFTAGGATLFVVD